MGIAVLLTALVGLAAAVPQPKIDPSINKSVFDPEERDIINEMTHICGEGKRSKSCPKDALKVCDVNFRQELQTQCKKMNVIIKDKEKFHIDRAFFSLPRYRLNHREQPYHRIMALGCCEEAEVAEAEANMKTLRATLEALDITQKSAKEQIKELLDPALGTKPLERAIEVMQALQTGISKLRSGLKLTKQFAEDATRASKGNKVLETEFKLLDQLVTEADKVLKPAQLVVQSVKMVAKSADVAMHAEVKKTYTLLFEGLGEVVTAAEDLPNFFGGAWDKLGDQAKKFITG
ncbi:hypothetical protein HIM_04105 [Hirsutella minnesotensis 3608]|uniref:NACHT-NTPase and P-loop NTPases N-terminal domain-containing protein n=1 Tax=Hirsutella minnesotensis 3608 TaxID=1043627 RepID=A0A0F7ZLG5_9HYPO|nr:hypothetical protein HIM_04105 [Hirsutella minnesotensis 3608]